jgi:hypothetical protein
VTRLAISWLLGLLGAVLGGAAGYYGFMYAKDHGFYAPVLAGGLVGVGCGLLSRHRSILRGVLCGIAGLLLGYYCDYYRITTDPPYESFAVYLMAFTNHGAIENILVFLGGLVSYWFGQSNWTEPRRGSAPAKPPEPDPEFQ